MPRTMQETPDRLRAGVQGRAIGVDREARIVRGYVVAQLGPFKSEGRGEFDQASLEQILELHKQAPLGLKSRFAHPSESNDGLGKFLGRSRDAWMGTTVNADGKEVPAVRADLHLDQAAFRGDAPSGNLGDYILDLAASDAEALSSSLVLRVDREYRINADGTPVLGADGAPLPPLWRPKKLFASDVVDEGDAVDGFLSAGEPRWTAAYLRRGEDLLNRLFAGQARNVVEARLTGFLKRYLDRLGGSQTVDKICKGCVGEGLGANLGALLNDLIEGQVSEERPRDSILQSMAEAAAIPLEQVNQIVAGDGDCPTEEVLAAFAQVLGAPVQELIGAAQEDGCDYPDQPGQDAPPAEPMAAAEPPAEPASIKRRRLQLKSKI